MVAMVGACVLMAMAWPAFAVPSASPTAAWTRQFGSPGFDLGRGVAVAGPAVYASGMVTGTIPGQPNAGGRDAFVRRYTTGGEISWTRQFGTNLDDYAHGVAANDTAVYVVGATYGALASEAATSGEEVFVRKYSPQGNVVWTRQFGTVGDDVGRAIAVSPVGVFIAGTTSDTLPLQTSAGGTDAFVRLYRFNGEIEWTHQFGTPAQDEIAAIAATPSGVYVAGSVDQALVGQSTAGGPDAFLRRYDNQGNIVWTRQFGTDSIDRAMGVAVASSGVYVGGYTGGALTSAPAIGFFDAFLRRYKPDGTATWTRQFGTPNGDQVDGLAATGTGAYVAASVMGELGGQTDAGERDAVVARYAADGALVWRRQFGTTASEAAHSIAAAPAGVYTVGFTAGTLPGQTPSGDWDVFARRYVSYRPDAAVSKSSSSGYLGDDIYNTTGANQTRTATVARGKQQAFFVRAVNDGDASDTFAFEGCGSTARFPVAYSRGGTNITAEVVDGSYRVADVAPGASATIRVDIGVALAASAGDTRTCAVTTSSMKRPALTDVAQARVEATP